MKKAIMSCIVILFSTSCIHQNFNIKKRIYFSEDVFKNWQLNTAITSDEKRKHFIKGNKGVEIYYLPNDSLIQVRAYNAVTTYDIFCLYHLRTKHQLQVGQGICNNPYGITKYYDKKGILLKEVDEEKECLFSIAQLINKIKKEYHRNLKRRNDSTTFRKIVKNGKCYYFVKIYTGDIYKKPTIHIIIDGNTGKTIQEIILQYKREGGVMSPFEEFIDKL